MKYLLLSLILIGCGGGSASSTHDVDDNDRIDECTIIVINCATDNLDENGHETCEPIRACVDRKEIEGHIECSDVFHLLLPALCSE